MKEQDREQQQGIALVVFAACIPVGEGLTALATLGLLYGVWRRYDQNLLSMWFKSPLIRNILWGWALWLLSGVVAIFVAHEGWPAISEFLRSFTVACCFLVVSLSVYRMPPIWLRHMGKAFLGALLISALFGLTQYGLNIRPGEFLVRSSQGAVSQALIPGTTQTVAGGFYFHRLKMAHVLLVGLAIMGSRQLFANMPHKQRLLEAAVALIYGTTLLLTFTRAALLACVCAGFIVACLASWAKLRWCCIFMLLLIGSIVLIPSLKERLASIQHPEASSVRALVWAQGVQIAFEHPWGCGLGNYPKIIDRYYKNVAPHASAKTYPRTYAHNILLTAWAETGPLGMLGMAYGWLMLAWACIRALRTPITNQDQSKTQQIAAMGLWLFILFWVLGMTHDVLYHQAVVWAYVATMAIVATQVYQRINV